MLTTSPLIAPAIYRSEKNSLRALPSEKLAVFNGRPFPKTVKRRFRKDVVLPPEEPKGGFPHSLASKCAFFAELSDTPLMRLLAIHTKLWHALQNDAGEPVRGFNEGEIRTGLQAGISFHEAFASLSLQANRLYAVFMDPDFPAHKTKLRAKLDDECMVLAEMLRELNVTVRHELKAAAVHANREDKLTSDLASSDFEVKHALALQL